MKTKPRKLKTNAKRLRQAADLLRAIVADGWELYVAGSGQLCMMSGPSHDVPRGQRRGADWATRREVPRRDRVQAQEQVPTLSGGDW